MYALVSGSTSWHINEYMRLPWSMYAFESTNRLLVDSHILTHLRAWQSLVDVDMAIDGSNETWLNPRRVVECMIVHSP